MNSSDMQWWHTLWARIVPAGGEVTVPSETLVIVLVTAGVIVAVPFIWRWFRLAITLVHELGHAIVGMLVGRKFTGFVLNGDMSGHAVTVGKPKGFGRVISTWAGYPAPAVIGALLAWLAAEGWAAPALTAVLLILLISLVRVRSLLTAFVMVVAIGSVGALWWWRDDALQVPVLLGIGSVLVVGAWRHLGAVWLSRDPNSDPAVLKQLTRIPVFLWNLSFALVCALATWVVWLAFTAISDLQLLQ